MIVTDRLDWLLDKSVLGGYTSLGYRARQRWWPSDPVPGALAGKRALVTGATSGIGLAAAEGLARLGAQVHVLGRDQEKTADAVVSVRDAVRESVTEADLSAPDPVEELCDLSDLRAVGHFVKAFCERHDTLDILVHSAGTMVSERQENPQGHELTFAIHVLAPLALTEGLRPLLAASDHARVVLVSSGGAYTTPLTPEIVDNAESTSGRYTAAGAYARTKRMQIALTEMLAERYAPEHIDVNAMHPGWVDSPGVREAMPRFQKLSEAALRTPEQGADTIVWLAAADDVVGQSGKLWHDRAARSTHYGPAQPNEEVAKAQLWRYCQDALNRVD